MGKISDELGIQSYCFRGFKDNAQVADLLRQCGSSAIELCAVHIDFSDRDQHAGVIETYRKAGVRICSMGVESLNQDEAALQARFDFCKLSGATVMTVSYSPATSRAELDTARRLAEQYDVRLAIHNHGGRDWMGNAVSLAYQFEQAEAMGNDRLGLCLDTAWALDAGEDPVGMAERFATRLFGIHIKDFVFDRARKPEDVVVGTGNLGLPRFCEVVTAAGFDGACVLEYEGDVNDPVPALTQCVDAVRKADGA